MKSQEELQKLYDECIEFWGVEAQLKQTQEECAELILSISHFLRDRSNSLQHLVEETADVYLMLNQVIRILGEKTVMEIVDYKADRVKNRIDEYRKENKD